MLDDLPPGYDAWRLASPPDGPEPCEWCHEQAGSGLCPACGGSTDEPNPYMLDQPCRECGGSGRCPECDGEGYPEVPEPDPDAERDRRFDY